MTPIKTLYLTEYDAKYVVNEDGSFLTIKQGNVTSLFQQVEGNHFSLEPIAGIQIENIQTTQVSETVESFEFGGYTFEWDNENVEFILSEIPPEFAGNGELVSHNFGVDELFLCNKDNEVVWGMLGGQKRYFEQSAIGKFSTASTKPQGAAEMETASIQTSNNVDFMLAGYIFVSEGSNTYSCIPVPPTR